MSGLSTQDQTHKLIYRPTFISKPTASDTMPALYARQLTETVAPAAKTGGVPFGTFKDAGVALAKRSVNDKNSFAYLWASPPFKYSLMIVVVCIVLIAAFFAWRIHRKRKMERMMGVRV